METERRIATKPDLAVSERLAADGLAIGGHFERERRISELGEEGTMRRITHWHRTLVVLAVGLLALAAPLVAYADGGPYGG
jgi:hypothetical protein